MTPEQYRQERTLERPFELSDARREVISRARDGRWWKIPESTLRVRPAEVRPLDRIPALDSVTPYVVGRVEMVDEPHPHTGRLPFWRITDIRGQRPYRYDGTHRCIVRRFIGGDAA